jgi:hypothetical protein
MVLKSTQSSVGSPSPHVEAMITIKEFWLKVSADVTSPALTTLALSPNFSVASLHKSFANPSAVPV